MSEADSFPQDRAPQPTAKPEELGILRLKYHDGQPVLTLTGGTAIPSVLAVEAEDGSLVAVYNGEVPKNKRGRVLALCALQTAVIGSGNK